MSYKDPKKQREAQRRYYRANRERILAKRQRRRQREREWLRIGVGRPKKEAA